LTFADPRYGLSASAGSFPPWSTEKGGLAYTQRRSGALRLRLRRRSHPMVCDLGIAAGTMPRKAFPVALAPVVGSTATRTDFDVASKSAYRAKDAF